MSVDVGAGGGPTDRDYDVVSQDQRSELTSDGRFHDVWEVRFRSWPSGQYGLVRIPVEAYTVAGVRAAIEAQREVLEGLHGPGRVGQGG